MFGIKKGFWGRIWKKVKGSLPAIVTFIAGIVKSEAEKAKEEPKKVVIRGTGGDDET